MVDGRSSGHEEWPGLATRYGKHGVIHRPAAHTATDTVRPLSHITTVVCPCSVSPLGHRIVPGSCRSRPGRFTSGHSLPTSVKRAAAGTSAARSA